MRRTITLAVVGTLAVGSLLASCGSEGSTLPAATTTAGGATADTTSDTPGDTTPGDGTTAYTGDGDSDYCQLVRKYDEESTIFDDLFTSETPDPAKTEAAFAALQAVIDQLVAIAPAEVKADAAVMGNATKQMIDLIAKYDYDFNALLASEDANSLNDLFNSAEIAAASDHLDQYDQQVCGITYDS